MLTTPSVVKATAANKRFSKQELFEELAWFMPAFAISVERLYGTGAATLMRSATEMPCTPNLDDLQLTPLWRSLSQLYDYGVEGVLPEQGDPADGSMADTEMFILGLDGLAAYLSEDEGGIPKLAKRTVMLAQARRIVDGGVAIINLDCDGPSAHLTREHVALLADVDVGMVDELIRLERCDEADSSERPNGGYVHVEAAKRFLVASKSYVPTHRGAALPFNFAKPFQVDLPVDIVRSLNDRSARLGLTPHQVLRSIFAEEIAHDCLYGTTAPLAQVRTQSPFRECDQ